MKRKQLSMKRLHILAGNFCISLGIERGTAVQQIMLDFLKYAWEHKEDEDLLDLPKVQSSTVK